MTRSIIKRFGYHLFKFYPKLPQNYKFVLLNYSVSGHYALINFFKMCGLNYVRLAEDNYMDYGETKSFLLNSKGDNIVDVRLYNNIRRLDHAKFFSYEAPVVITVRDPISRLKTHINHGYLKRKSQFEFSLKDDIDKSLPEIVYSGALTPQITDLEKIFDKKFIDFKYQSNLTPFLTNEGGGVTRQIIYIDTQDLQADKAFNTMQKLSKLFHFNPPKEEDKAKFERKVWNNYALFLSFTLFINHKDFSYLKDKIKIIITEEPLNQLKDIKNLFLNENDLCYKHLSINVEQKYYELIKEDKEIKERLKSYFKEFVKVLDEKVRFRKDNALSEQDILNYFKANKTLALKFKNILDKELTHIKQTRPDIIQSWNYYKEFERICGEIKG
ncbi:DUF2972 domain-containing protein [Campylobacter helveticus]|uniref:DUF2972 domain-containing protein n=1 Tax=Campylobacter helveticus TaxID=28898 RepID=UPI00105168C7|nr:DUF2972 domain-containing protein [Campylobacter helveticus]QBL11060.1 DUF2972 domain-containing protein [Campylobacter helveticus]